jgi:antitoxin CptB
MTVGVGAIAVYLLLMLADPELKRLHWRAHHRGTREADMMIGGFFDARHLGWSTDERAAFAALLDEQDVDIMAWALGKQDPPAIYTSLLPSLRQLDYIKVAR